MAKTVPKVFLDANVVIQAGKPPGGPIMARIADLVKAELIEILTTDLTITEVAKKHAENDYEVIKEVGRPHFRKVVTEHLGISLPEVSKAELKAAISKTYVDQVAAMFRNLKAKTLAIDNVKPSTVFAAYGEESGFFAGVGKKHQFPDAFIFECLKGEASAESPVIIVSTDEDFDAPVKEVEHLSLVKTIPELFQNLSLQVEAPAIEAFLEEQEGALLRLVDAELNDWGLQVSDVEDAEIEESTVINVDLANLISFKSIEKGGSILVVGTAEITAKVSYTHPNWDEATYDSEDKVLIPFDTVSGETEVTLKADCSMSVAVDADDGFDGIEEFRFRSADHVYVELYPFDPYQ